jgi:hypothetical protein
MSETIWPEVLGNRNESGPSVAATDRASRIDWLSSSALTRSSRELRAARILARLAGQLPRYASPSEGISQTMSPEPFSFESDIQSPVIEATKRGV